MIVIGYLLKSSRFAVYIFVEHGSVCEIVHLKIAFYINRAPVPGPRRAVGAVEISPTGIGNKTI